MVTADLPAFLAVGQKIDVTASAMGNAKSLRGGVTLLMTELRGADGQVYAIAQGSLLVSGFEASGQAVVDDGEHPDRGANPLRRDHRAYRQIDLRRGRQRSSSILDQRSFGNAARIASTRSIRAWATIAEARGPAQIRRPGAQRRRRRAGQVRFIADLLDIDIVIPGGAGRRSGHRRAQAARSCSSQDVPDRPGGGGLWQPGGDGQRDARGLAAGAVQLRRRRQRLCRACPGQGEPEKTAKILEADRTRRASPTSCCAI